MRVVRAAADFAGAFEQAQRESQVAFGSSDVFLEKYIPRARHIEVQLLGDLHGNLVHLYRTRLLDPATPSEGRRNRAGSLAQAGTSRQAVRGGARHRPGTPLRERGNGRIPGRCRHGRVLFHRGQSADSGRAHRHGRSDGHRHREVANPRRRGAPPFRSRNRPGIARGRCHDWLCRSMPRDDRGSHQQLHARPWTDHALPLGKRNGHSPRRGDRVLWSGRHAVLRFAAW